MRTRWGNNYFRETLEVIHINVKRCKGGVSWIVPYGSFTISVTRELLARAGVKFDGDEDVILAAHHIASRMEEKSNG